MASVAAVPRKVALTTWEGIWYVLQCIAFGAGYFAKVPVKKALQDLGLCEMTSAERFWYVLMCIPFGAGFFAKVPVAKALSELPQYRADRTASLGTLMPIGGGLPSPNIPNTRPEEAEDKAETIADEPFTTGLPPVLPERIETEEREE